MAFQTADSSSAKIITIGMAPTRYEVITPLLSQLHPTKTTNGIVESHHCDPTARKLQLVSLANGDEVVIQNTTMENMEILMPFVRQLLHYDVIETYRYEDEVLTLTGRGGRMSDDA